MDPNRRKALGTLLTIPLSKTGCSIWKEKAKDGAGLEESSSYLTHYPFNCLGLTVVRGPMQMWPSQTEELVYSKFFPDAVGYFSDGVGSDIRNKASHWDLMGTPVEANRELGLQN